MAGNGVYPSGPFTPTTAGTYNFVAAYSGDSNNAAVTSPCNDSSERVDVTGKVTPSLLTHASANMAVGGSISDTSDLSGGLTPTGTITFTVFGPDDSTCSTTPAFTATKNVTGDGTYKSGSFIALVPGAYRFVASYSGDAANNAVATGCNDPSESVNVSQATPMLVTAASPSTTVGAKISDKATLSSGFKPTGTITFDLYGPNNPTCSGAPLATTTRTVTGNGTYFSAAFTTRTAGDYHYVTAYSGDANNVPTGAACGATGETVTVNRIATTTALSSSANPSVFGQSVTFTATVTGATGKPAGTVTFSDGTTNLGTVALTGTTIKTASLTTTNLAAGAHNITATYNGNARFAPSTSPVLIQQVNPAATTLTARPAVLQVSPLGVPLYQLSATLTRSDNGTPLPGQTIIFSDGPTVLCQATTDTTGTAICSALASLVTVTLNLGYTATFQGTANYLPSTSTAPIVG